MDRLPATVHRRPHWQARRARLYALLEESDRAREHYRAALAAMDTLPASRRNTRAMRELEEKIRTALRSGG